MLNTYKSESKRVNKWRELKEKPISTPFRPPLWILLQLGMMNSCVDFTQAVDPARCPNKLTMLLAPNLRS